MRQDVNKILTECYKEGPHGNKFPRRAVNKRFDEVGGKMGMHFLYEKVSKAPSKSFGENLSYLERFLAKQVGRKWNDIYSEICSTFDRRSAVNAHIFQHLFDYFVRAEELLVIDGELYRQNRYFGKPTPLSEAVGFNGKMYVDPRDGILKLNPAWKSYAKDKAEHQAKEKAKEAETFRVLSPVKEMHKLDGVWYVFTLKPLPERKTVYVCPRPRAPIYCLPLSEVRDYLELEKNFKKLSEKEQKELGAPMVVGFTVPDIYKCIPEYRRSVLTKDRREKVEHRVYADVKASHYYAEKKTASRKELKAAGL